MQTALVIGLSVAVFLALITNFTTKPAVNGRWNVILSVIALAGGFTIYGYAFLHLEHTNLPYAVIRTVHSTLHMFVSANEYAEVRSVPGFETLPVMVIFWVIHSFAFYATANAFIKLLGGELLRRVRLFLCRFRDIIIVYGINDKSVGFLTELMHRERAALLVIDTLDQADLYRNTLEDLGGIVLTSVAANAPGDTFIRKAGLRKGKHHYRIYALHGESTNNLYFANLLKQAMHRAEISPSQTSLVLFAGADVAAADSAQSVGEHYGYGTVSAFNHADLAARLMVLHYPPYQAVTFDEKGYSQEVFDAVIVGFGAAGKAALRHLYMNSSFLGKGNHFAVFDPGLDSVDGLFNFVYPGLKASGNVEFFACDARSQTFVDYIEEHAHTLNYVVLCCGTEKMNAALDQALRFRSAHFDHPLTLIHCTTHMVSCRRSGASMREHWDIYTVELLGDHNLDQAPKRLNYKYYENTGLTLEEAWNQADYFSRMSCKAFTDFLPAFLAMAHLTPEEILSGQKPFPPSKEVLEVLSQAEHLRWCNFHLCMGYSPMGEEVLSERLKKARAMRLSGETPLAPQKDPQHHLHACLLPWEELDNLSQKVSKALGSQRDYKQMDRDNVLLIEPLLKDEAKKTGTKKAGKKTRRKEKRKA